MDLLDQTLNKDYEMGRFSTKIDNLLEYLNIPFEEGSRLRHEEMEAICGNKSELMKCLDHHFAIKNPNDLGSKLLHFVDKFPMHL